MGRKSKLTDKQWAEIERRMLEGEATRSLAREFKISESSIRERKSAQVTEIKTVANQIVATEQALKALPISAQISAQNLASKLRAISDNLASAAHFGSATAHRLNAIANTEVSKIDDAYATSGESLQTLMGVAKFTAVANEAAKAGFNLLAANKEHIANLNQQETKAVLTLRDFYGE